MLDQGRKYLSVSHSVSVFLSLKSPEPKNSPDENFVETNIFLRNIWALTFHLVKNDPVSSNRQNVRKEGLLFFYVASKSDVKILLTSFISRRENILKPGNRTTHKL